MLKARPTSCQRLHQDYYTILGVPRDADDQTIKRAFRKLAFEYHPDRNKAPGAEDRFKEISEAYAVLSDPDKRAAFDAGEAQGASVSASDDIFSNIDFRDLFSGLGFDFAGAGRFDQFMRQRRRGRASRGANLEAELTITLERVATGGEETLHLRRPTACPACHGTGAQPGTQPERCPECQGRGGTGPAMAPGRTHYAASHHLQPLSWTGALVCLSLHHLPGARKSSNATKRSPLTFLWVSKTAWCSGYPAKACPALIRQGLPAICLPSCVLRLTTGLSAEASISGRM